MELALSPSFRPEGGRNPETDEFIYVSVILDSVGIKIR